MYDLTGWVKLSCGHAFHGSCVADWHGSESPQSNTCAVCRETAKPQVVTGSPLYDVDAECALLNELDVAGLGLGEDVPVHFVH